MNFKDADQGRNYLLIMQVGTVGLFFLLVFVLMRYSMPRL